MICRCRNCGSKYDEAKSRAEFKGYCGQACLHEKAWRLGYRKRKEKYSPSEGSEYGILSKANMIGSIPYGE